jgi:pilus assembly protein Flp/PilA
MQGVISRVQRFLTSEDGPTAVEYAVMLALIVVACIVSINTLSGNVQSTFSKVGSSIGS